MSENERLAERLSAIATALKPPAANGHGVDDDPTPVTLGYLASLVQDMGASIREELHRRDEQIAALEQRLADVEKRKGLAPLAARIGALEARPHMAYEGIWNEKKAYPAGSFVTFQGGLWFAEDTSLGVRPGAGSSAWKLAVKRGKADR